MSVGANTYGAVAGLERLIGDIVASRTFGTGTVPTLVQAEAELDNVAAEINAELDVQGYAVPIVNADFPTAYAAAKAANEYGAAARLLSTIPSEAYDPAEQVEEIGESRPQQYEKLLNRFLARIKNQRLRSGRRVGRLSRVFSGAQEDENGNEKSALFTRDMDSYPGGRVFTEGDKS